ncbi:hypothetical protein [Alienimonas californiensis]|uniref:Uncharacterized protein n=1 Tax=Alienimonas californiensis TaxID=2527989 RepID=A0A517P5K6_9PLAN|nr:hypothetical protein [Alienimonas californiensis]QDT14660.1 hypothetical protein CA12_07370 [Alienimonas californiensis]
MMNWFAAHAHWFAYGAAFSAFIALSVWYETVLSQRKRAALHPYLGRSCRGIRWHRRFPGAPHDEIRRFVRGFAECFRVAPHLATQFGPDDRPFVIWDEATVGGPFALDDNEELYDWGVVLEEEYRISPELQATWDERTTLADVFALTRSAG